MHETYWHVNCEFHVLTIAIIFAILIKLLKSVFSCSICIHTIGNVYFVFNWGISNSQLFSIKPYIRICLCRPLFAVLSLFETPLTFSSEISYSSWRTFMQKVIYTMQFIFFHKQEICNVCPDISHLMNFNQINIHAISPTTVHSLPDM